MNDQDDDALRMLADVVYVRCLCLFEGCDHRWDEDGAEAGETSKSREKKSVGHTGIYQMTKIDQIHMNS